jgi:hypothetical protein
MYAMVMSRTSSWGNGAGVAVGKGDAVLINSGVPDGVGVSEVWKVGDKIGYGVFCGVAEGVGDGVGWLLGLTRVQLIPATIMITARTVMPKMSVFGGIISTCS